MFSLSRLAKVGYLLICFFVVCLLLLPSSSQAQKGFGVSTGFRSTPGLPTIAVPMISASNGGFGAFGGGGLRGISGAVGGGNVSGSVSTQIVTINLGEFFPNNGQIIGLPPPTLMPPLNNLFSDTTGSPWALLFTGIPAAGGGAGGVGGGRGVAGGGGAVGIMGIGGGVGGAGGVGGGGTGGFAGKGLGGFNGRKPL